MKEIIIDCSDISTPAQLHRRLKEALCFPDWYGHNLDALYDCLGAVSADTRLVLLHFDELPFPCGGFLRVLRDSESRNPHLEISLLAN